MERDEYLIFFPMNYNDGAPVPDTIVTEFLEDLFVIAGGHTVGGTVKGTYRMKSGKKQEDVLLRIEVAPPSEAVPELRRLVAVYGERLGQETMYFKRTGGTVEFVAPIPVQGVK